MGGLLIGHVDHEGNNVVVCGFFRVKMKPHQATVNSTVRSALLQPLHVIMPTKRWSFTPNLRAIGWIHTHPDIGIFLSGIDINTFRSLRAHSFEQRCVAVVVDPLRQEHGVFTSERNAENRHAGTANDKIKLSEDLQAHITSS